MLNEIPFSTSRGVLKAYSQPSLKKRQFVDWFKTRPELCAPVTIRVNDTITEVDFYDTDGSPLEGRKYKKAKEFWDKNQLYKRLKSYQYDRIITGSGFLWKGSAINQRSTNKDAYISSMKQIATRTAKKALGDIQTREADYLADKLFLRAMDEDLRKTRMVDYIASSTMTIVNDKYDIIEYTQILGADHDEKFNTEEIIHTPFMDIDGKVDGYTPVMGLGYEMVLSWAIKENMLSYFRNGAVTGKMIIMPDEIATSENFNWLKQELMNNGILENRHGHLLLTGQVDVKDLEDSLKDMEYEALFLQIKSTVANAIMVPLSRLDNYSGKGGGDAGGLADSGYWSGIESDQRVIEMDLNSQLFSELGFNIKFKKPYKIDEVREAQAANQNISFILQANNGLKNGYQKRIKISSYLNMISGNSREISVGDVEDIPEDELMLPTEKNSMLNQTFMKDKEVLPSKAQQNKAQTKRGVAENKNQGTSPGGF